MRWSKPVLENYKRTPPENGDPILEDWSITSQDKKWKVNKVVICPYCRKIRYVLFRFGTNTDCIGGFDSVEEAKSEASKRHDQKVLR